MVKVFQHTNEYDHAIVNYFKDNKETLRYGENPQQSAYFVRTSDSKHTIAGAKQLHGKQLSFNNIKDADAALSLVKIQRANCCSSKTYEPVWSRNWMKHFNMHMKRIINQYLAGL